MFCSVQLSVPHLYNFNANYSDYNRWSVTSRSLMWFIYNNLFVNLFNSLKFYIVKKSLVIYWVKQNFPNIILYLLFSVFGLVLYPIMHILNFLINDSIFIMKNRYYVEYISITIYPTYIYTIDLYAILFNAFYLFKYSSVFMIILNYVFVILIRSIIDE